MCKYHRVGIIPSFLIIFFDKLVNFLPELKFIFINLLRFTMSLQITQIQFSRVWRRCRHYKILYLLFKIRVILNYKRCYRNQNQKDDGDYHHATTSFSIFLTSIVRRILLIIVILLCCTHQLNFSDMFPALSLLVKSSQGVFEGGDLSLHLNENACPLVRFFIFGYKVSQLLF